jgi:hypothetical protein
LPKVFPSLLVWFQVRGRAPDDGDELGEGRLLNLGEEGGVRVGVSVSESDIIVLSKAFS